jgi:hypothetical protein
VTIPNVRCSIPGAICLNALVPSTNAEQDKSVPGGQPPAASPAESSRKLLFAVVMGVVVLNVVLFVKFGLKEKSGPAGQSPATISNPAASNATPESIGGRDGSSNGPATGK